jgi:hypothetical protein
MEGGISGEVQRQLANLKVWPIPILFYQSEYRGNGWTDLELNAQMDSILFQGAG